MRRRIESDDFLSLAEGHQGAFKVMAEFTNDNEGFMDLYHLGNMNIRGSQIWIAYNDYCGGDIELFKTLIRDGRERLVEAVNIAGAKRGIPFKAVRRGAYDYTDSKQFEFTKKEQEEYALKEFKSYSSEIAEQKRQFCENKIQTNEFGA